MAIGDMNEFELEQHEKMAESYTDQHTDYYTIAEFSTLPMTVARDFVNEQHKRIITTENSWRDPNTGKVYLFEKQGVTNLEI